MFLLTVNSQNKNTKKNDIPKNTESLIQEAEKAISKENRSQKKIKMRMLINIIMKIKNLRLFK